MRRLIVLALSALGSAAPAGSSPGGAPAVPAEAKSRSWELALAPSGEPGRPFVIEGRLLGLPDSLPIHDATIYVYHADAHGNYGARGDTKPRLAGTVRTNIAGGFRIRTILPGMYDGTPHVHFRVTGPGLESQRGTLSLPRRQGAGSDSAYNSVPWMVTLPGPFWTYVEPAADGGFRTTWNLCVPRAARR